MSTVRGTGDERAAGRMDDSSRMHDEGDAEAVILAAGCGHHWVSEHKPGHIVYWVKTCTICHAVDWDDLDDEIRASVADMEVQP